MGNPTEVRSKNWLCDSVGTIAPAEIVVADPAVALGTATTGGVELGPTATVGEAVGTVAIAGGLAGVAEAVETTDTEVDADTGEITDEEGAFAFTETF